MAGVDSFELDDALGMHRIRARPACPHAALLPKLATFLDALKSQEFGVCHDCKMADAPAGTEDPVWLCMLCATFGCSRFYRGHALYHAERACHPLSISLGDLSVWCYECDGGSYIDTFLVPDLHPIFSWLHVEVITAWVRAWTKLGRRLADTLLATTHAHSSRLPHPRCTASRPLCPR